MSQKALLHRKKITRRSNPASERILEPISEFRRSLEKWKTIEIKLTQKTYRRSECLANRTLVACGCSQFYMVRKFLIFNIISRICGFAV
jgi:hypothetical protein